MVTPDNEVYTYHYDGNANTIAITDAAKQPVNTYAYTPYGLIAAQEETIEQPFTFAGMVGIMGEGDPANGGLYYMRARYYDPAAGRFISEDPIGFAGGDVSLYGYVGASPLMFVDPSGLKTYGANRQIGGNNSRSKVNPLTHTFIFTTENNSVDNTYSWGNSYQNGNGVWHRNHSNDVDAAKESLENGDAWLIGGESLDASVEATYLQRISDASHPSRNHGWSIINNCKHEAYSLIQDAKSQTSSSYNSPSVQSIVNHTNTSSGYK
ncbi:MAG: RHS repeat-associated core domain-containing protein [Candidatus Omnitrophota bacterium]